MHSPSLYVVPDGQSSVVVVDLQVSPETVVPSGQQREIPDALSVEIFVLGGHLIVVWLSQLSG